MNLTSAKDSSLMMCRHNNVLLSSQEHNITSMYCYALASQNHNITTCIAKRPFHIVTGTVQNKSINNNHQLYHKDIHVQARQTRQNSGGVAGVAKIWQRKGCNNYLIFTR